jgi:two-component system C4-dicarboxylate transport sensor histidine kinase DctB
VLSLIAVTACSAAIAGALAARFERRDRAQALASEAIQRRELLRSELERHRLLPQVLASDREMFDVLGGTYGRANRMASVASLNARLDALARSDGAATVYLIERNGITIASSNYRSTASFVGQNYSFRPYFRDAMATGTGTFFAQGTVSGIAGLYLARRIDRGAGVVVVKVEFGALEGSWRQQGGQTAVVDSRDRILLTSHPESRFSVLKMQAPEVAIVRAMTAVPNTDWRLAVERDISGALRRARILGSVTGGLGGLLAGISLLLWWSIRNRRRHVTEELASQVALRTAELRHEIEERSRVDARLQSLREDLIQANKLAALGQISAGVAHEINQPVAAIRSYVDNAKTLLARGRVDTALTNMRAIAGLTEKIGAITSELRDFARKVPATLEQVAVDAVIDHSLMLINSQLRARGVQLLREPQSHLAVVTANRVRLEQVVVNLLQNAIDALHDCAKPCILIAIERDESQGVRLRIEDNGPGVHEAQLPNLFAPFATSKPTGLGLGLVISRDILAEFGAVIDYSRSPLGGACFSISFPKAAS